MPCSRRIGGADARPSSVTLSSIEPLRIFTTGTLDRVLRALACWPRHSKQNAVPTKLKSPQHGLLMLFHCNSKIVRCADRRRLTTCTNSASTPLPHPTSVDGYLQVFTTGRSQGCRARCCSGGLRYREATERYGRDQCGRSAAPCRFNHSFARRIRAKPKCERSHWPDHQDRQPGQVTIVARGPQRGSLLVLGTLTSV